MGVSDSKGAVFNSQGFDVDQLLKIKSKYGRVTSIVEQSSISNNNSTIKLFGTTLSMLKWIDENKTANGNDVDYDILVDSSPGGHVDTNDSSSNENTSTNSGSAIRVQETGATATVNDCDNHAQRCHGCSRSRARAQWTALVEPSILPSMTLGTKCPCIEFALMKKKSVVLANKSPLVMAWNRLQHLVKIANIINSNVNNNNNGNGSSDGSRTPCMMLYSATVCGGLPVVNVLGRDLLPSLANVDKIEGIFNSTSNYILTQLHNQAGGGSCRGGGAGGNSGSGQDVFENALKEAQRRGIAETDPSLDIDGWDTAYKLYIILKRLGMNEINIKDIKVTGLRDDPLVGKNSSLFEEICKAKENGEKIKLVASARRRKNKNEKNEKDNLNRRGDHEVNDANKFSFDNISDKWEFNVRLEKVDVLKNSFIANCDNTDMAIVLKSDLFDTWYFKSDEYGVTPTSAAVLRDIITIVDEQNKAQNCLFSKL